MFRPQYLAGTVVLWLVYFLGLVIYYVMTSWLPTLVHSAGFTVSRAATVMAMFPLGGAVGTLALGLVMERLGSVRMIALTYAAAGVLIWLLGSQGGTLTLLYVLVFAAGATLNGAQLSMPALSAGYYPTLGRATGTSWMVGFGRVGGIFGAMAGGILLELHWGFAAIFAVLSLPAFAAAAALLLSLPVFRPGAPGATCRKVDDRGGRRLTLRSGAAMSVGCEPWPTSSCSTRPHRRRSPAWCRSSPKPAGCLPSAASRARPCGTSPRSAASPSRRSTITLRTRTPSSRPLMLGITRIIHDRVAARLDPAHLPLEQLRLFMVETASCFEDYRWAWIASASIFWNDPHERHRAERLEWRDRYEGLLRGILHAAKARGDTRDMDVSLAGRLVLSTLNWLPRWHNPAGPLRPTEIAEQFYGMLLHGFQVRGSAGGSDG